MGSAVCLSAGHDVVMLDYRACGREGEPEIVHVDQEDDYEITFLADNFEAFIRGLVSDEEYDTSEEDKEHDLNKVAHGKFSPLLEELCSGTTEVEHGLIYSRVQYARSHLVTRRILDWPKR
ncbi:hypothetical protein ABH899_002527 [Paenibacillus sp. RC84]